MKYVNMTIHQVNLFDENGKTIQIFESEGNIRLVEKRVLIEKIDGISIFQKEYSRGSIPTRKNGKIFIVSSIVALAFKDREDFIVPDELIRDEKGRIKGCKSFATFSNKEINQFKCRR